MVAKKKASAKKKPKSKKKASVKKKPRVWSSVVKALMEKIEAMKPDQLGELTDYLEIAKKKNYTKEKKRLSAELANLSKTMRMKSQRKSPSKNTTKTTKKVAKKK